MDRSQQMGEGSIPRLLFRFSIPAIVGMLVNALYNVVDRVFIGWGVGALGIAGVTIGFPIMIVQMAFGMLIGMGAATLVSIRLGEKKREEAERIIGNALSLLVAISLVLAAAGLIWLRPLLILFGASPAILAQGEQYLSVILAGSVFMGVGFGMNGFIRAEGNPRIAMLTMIIGAVLNTILDPIFIFWFKMGVRGAAIATVISQATSAAWVLAYFLRGKSLLKLRLANLKVNQDIAWSIAAIGFAPFAMQLAASVLNAILTRQLQRYGGDLAIAAMGILFSVSMLILMPVFGLNQGAQPLIGYNYGADHRRCQRGRAARFRPGAVLPGLPDPAVQPGQPGAAGHGHKGATHLPAHAADSRLPDRLRRLLPGCRQAPAGHGADALPPGAHPDPGHPDPAALLRTGGHLLRGAGR
jgi:putative MATE family efflux protein